MYHLCEYSLNEQNIWTSYSSSIKEVILHFLSLLVFKN